MQKVYARSISSSAQEHLRQLAVKAVLDGKKQKEVAELFGITPQTVCIWVKAYRLQGQGALKSKQKGRPQGGKLLPWQAAQIAKTVIDHHPEQLKLPFYLWTREAVALLIKRRFGLIVVSLDHRPLSQALGFYPAETGTASLGTKPGTGSAIAGGKREYPRIRRQAQKEKAHIYWGDTKWGCGYLTAAGRSYGLKMLRRTWKRWMLVESHELFGHKKCNSSFGPYDAVRD